MRFEVLKAVQIFVLFYWVMKLCRIEVTNVSEEHAPSICIVDARL